MTAAWTSLGQLHLLGARLRASSLGPRGEAIIMSRSPSEAVILPRRRRRQAVQATPTTVDLRAFHDQVAGDLNGTRPRQSPFNHATSGKIDSEIFLGRWSWISRLHAFF
jgi:hypothetical protein